VSKTSDNQRPRIAVDTGGTFTDFVRIRDRVIEVSKELSTPSNPERSIIRGLKKLDTEGDTHPEIIHGSTVATNALLERKGARTALITTSGFEDVLVIGRQTRRDLYDIFTTRPDALVADALRIGIRQRTLYDGTRQTALKKKDIHALVRKLKSLSVESVAVSLLFSFVDPSDEQAIGDALGKLGIPISLSSSILPEYREYERTSTTVINAYLAPVMRRYLGQLADTLADVSIRVMQSNGGAVRAATAMDAPVQTILSGPAGGVVGAFSIGERSGYTKLITFDMGGTSTDVALLDGQIRVTHENHVDGLPIGVPMMDMQTVGAGGGSIAHEDAGGALKVGPESAGADPGPICYGKGTEFTVTDANVVLGRLLPRFFLGGAMDLAVDRIAPAVGRLRWARKWPNLERMAEGVIEVVNNNMEQAIRLISVERGHDVRDFTLVTFGGAGALHAATLATGLGIPRIIVPPHPGALSALGLLLADARKDYSRTLIGQRITRSGIRATLAELHREGLTELRREGFGRRDIVVMDFVDVRYQGQSYELTIPFTRDWESSFHRAHDQRYGHSNPSGDIEVVNARSTLLGKNAKPKFKRARRKTVKVSPVAREPVWANGAWTKFAIYDRLTLQYGNVIKGPAIIGEYSSTTYVPPEFRCDVDAWGNLVLTGR
jgi:N-methylhydantoinase A